ncbi:unnamed protein product [Allacma fusca]|uniref:Mevalonate kinase n=1 Tax=Allacma fusca TaxID=39272 RepID=A0A8J2JRD1_9HEXA|nr:unnamed protein product [Allacma fusca]
MVLPKKTPKEIYCHDQLVTRTGAAGSVILHGEHTLTSGKKAIAVSTNTFTQCKLDPIKMDKVEFKFPRFKLYLSIPLVDLADLKQRLGKRFMFSELDQQSKIPLTDEARTLIQTFVGNLKLNPPEGADITNYFKFAEAYIGIYCAMFDDEIDSIEFTSNTEVPGLEAGLTAAFAVSVTAAILHYHELIPNRKDTQREHREKIYKWALFAQRFLIDGEPTGVDVHVSTFGQAVKFWQASNGAISWEEIKFPDLRVNLVLASGPNGSFDSIFEQSQSKKQRDAKTIKDAIDKIGELTEKQLDEIKCNGTLRGDYIHNNHELLKSLGVSNEKIDKVVDIAEKVGLPAKMTNTGAGGIVLIYIPENSSPVKTHQLREALFKEQLYSADARLGTDGVAIDKADIRSISKLKIEQIRSFPQVAEC